MTLKALFCLNSPINKFTNGTCYANKNKKVQPDNHHKRQIQKENQFIRDKIKSISVTSNYNHQRTSYGLSVNFEAGHILLS